MPRTARAGALAAAVLALIAVPATAAPARAATRAITPDYITVDTPASPDGNLGLLSVAVDSTSPVTSFTLHVHNASTNADLLDPATSEASNVNDGSYWQSTWIVKAPVTTTQLPLGDYAVTADVTDQAGNQADGLYAGPWEFTPSAEVTLTADSTTIDYDHPTATITGTVRLLYPGGTTAPYQGPVQLYDDWGSSPTLETSSTGAFSTKVTPADISGTGLSDYAYAQVADSATGRGGDSTTLGFSITPNPTRLTATLAPRNSITYGTNVTLSGSLTYQRNDAGSLVPFATSMPVTIDNNGKPTRTVKTNSKGGYSVTLPRTAGTIWSANFVPPSDLLTPQQDSLPLTVTIPTAFTGFKGSVNSHGSLKLSTCLGFTTTVPGLSLSPYYFQQGGSFQYSTHKGGPWNNFAYASSGSTCGHGGLVYTLTGSAPYRGAYYRVTFATQRDANQYYTIYHSATSGEIYLKV